MVASPVPNPARAWRRRAWAILLSVPVAAAAGCWWLTTPPVDDAPDGTPETTAPTATAGAKNGPVEPGFPDWPAGRLEGKAAGRLLLDTLLRVQRRLEKVAGYTATFRKRERIKDVLGPEQTIAMKIRNRPFAVYLKYLAPQAGKEVVFAEGHHEDKIIAHGGGLARLLVPRLALPPDHPLALADARHPITEAGLANLTARLIGFRRMDLDDPGAMTVVDRTHDEQGRPWLRSLHEHPVYDPRRPFARIEVLYDPESRLPLQIRSYDWPQPGHQGELLLAECYVYEDLNLEAVLGALDFDPSNPAYAFHRY